MNRAILLCTLLLAACGSATDVVQDGDEPASNITSRGLIEPASTDRETAIEAVEEPAVDEEFEGALGNVDAAPPAPPADVPTLGGLLRAHHVADLPDGETLRSYDTGESSLQWLANYGDSMATRTRALFLLEHFATEASRAFALDYLDHESPQLQAAAITALAGRDLNNDPEALSAVAASLRIEDVRVILAAVQTLSESEAGRAALAEAASDESLSASAREAAAAAIVE